MVNPNPAIYAIENKTNHKMYIGGATYPSQRWSEHKSALRLNRHRNQPLQDDWNKYGEDNFLFVIIERVEKEYLSAREDYHIRQIRNTYNILSGYAGRLRDNENDTDEEWRPELTGYKVYAKILLDKMDNSLNTMTVTDVVKILIEQAIEKNHPNIKVTKRRKIYEKIDY